MEANIVRSRLVHYYVPGKDLITGNEVNTERMASAGQRLHAEEGTDTDTDRYGVPQEWIDKLQRDGHLFSGAEIDAALGGITDDMTVHETLGDEVRGDTRTSTSTSVRDPDASAVSSLGGGEGWHPLAFTEMEVWQLAEYLRTEPDMNDIMQSIQNVETGPARERLANNFLNAARSLGEDVQEEYVNVLAEALGFAAAGPGPDDEGIAGTEPGGALSGVEGGSAQDEAGSEADESDDGSEGSPYASEAAKEAAEEAGLDPDEVSGTGSGGKITKADVEKHVKENG